MTCIVGIERDGLVYIGGDSAASAGSGVDVRSDNKVFVNDNYVMGFTTSFRMGQILRYSLSVPIQSPQQDDMQFMCTTFVDAVRTCFYDKGFRQKDEESNADSGGVFLVGYQGKLYYVGTDFQVGRNLAGYEAVGCGAAVAKGVLYAHRNSNDPKWILEEALKGATELCSGVRPPYHILCLDPAGNVVNDEE